VVGTTGRIVGGPQWENRVEEHLATLVETFVWSGLMESARAGYVRADGRRLPFADNSFDVVFSNAVIEHVGSFEDQLRFVNEHKRVGRHWVITTPNRWFPIESHTNVLFRHWSAGWRARQDSFARLLSLREFRSLTCGEIVGHMMSPTFIAWGSGAGQSP
jgi:SAM-dependent methyltransferase